MEIKLETAVRFNRAMAVSLTSGCEPQSSKLPQEGGTR